MSAARPVWLVLRPLNKVWHNTQKKLLKIIIQWLNSKNMRINRNSYYDSHRHDSTDQYDAQSWDQLNMACEYVYLGSISWSWKKWRENLVITEMERKRKTQEGEREEKSKQCSCGPLLCRMSILFTFRKLQKLIQSSQSQHF